MRVCGGIMVYYDGTRRYLTFRSHNTPPHGRYTAVILRYFKVFWYFRDMADIAPCGGARAVVIRGKGAFAAVCECPCGKVPV